MQMVVMVVLVVPNTALEFGLAPNTVLEFVRVLTYMVVIVAAVLGPFCLTSEYHVQQLPDLILTH